MAASTGARVQLLRPAAAVWRAPGVLQIGLDPPALVLSGVPKGLAQAVPLLAHPRTVEGLGTLLSGVDPPWISWLLSRLADAGMLVPAPASPDPSVLVVGTGNLAKAVAAGLLQAKTPARRLDPGAFTSLPPRPDGAELVLLATGSVEPDRAITDALSREGRTHLIARLEPDRAVVGPLVQPGRTSCIRCSDLTRAHSDPAWPLLLAQLCHEPVEPLPAQLAWAAATAVAQVGAWRSGRPSDVCGGAIELTFPDHRLQGRTWPAHPGCGCLLTPG